MFVTGNGAAAGGALGSAAAAVTTANVGARMLTNKRVLDWVSKAPKVKEQNVPAHLAKLGVIYNETDDETLREELDRYLESLQETTAGMPKRR
jgi:hypothetical protein